MDVHVLTKSLAHVEHRLQVLFPLVEAVYPPSAVTAPPHSLDFDSSLMKVLAPALSSQLGGELERPLAPEEPAKALLDHHRGPQHLSEISTNDERPPATLYRGAGARLDLSSRFSLPAGESGRGWGRGAEEKKEGERNASVSRHPQRGACSSPSRAIVSSHRLRRGVPYYWGEIHIQGVVTSHSPRQSKVLTAHALHEVEPQLQLVRHFFFFFPLNLTEPKC